MTKTLLAFVAALGFFRVLDAAGISAAVLFALVALAVSAGLDLTGALGRKLRGAVPPKGGRA